MTKNIFFELNLNENTDYHIKVLDMNTIDIGVGEVKNITRISNLLSAPQFLIKHVKRVSADYENATYIYECFRSAPSDIAIYFYYYAYLDYVNMGWSIF